MPEDFEPVIVAFTCNWCGYPAARLAGVQHIEYPNGVKPVRVMCTGRVDPSMIMKAFEMGADGVAVVGCRMDECHFVEGNKRAEERIEGLRTLLDQLGLGSQRLGAEWLKAAETKKFAGLMNRMNEEIKALGPNPMPRVPPRERGEALFEKEVIDEIISDTGAHDCVECGKCTSVCPVAKYDPDFAPRTIVLRALEGVQDQLIGNKDIWECLTCERCNVMCPYEVDYSEFIRSMRTEVAHLGDAHESVIEECPQGGMLQSMMRIMAHTGGQKRLGWLSDDLKVASEGDVFYFTGCLAHLDTIYRDRQLNLTETAVAAVKLMNAAGIEPVVSNDEVCCGHDLNWVGDDENFERLMRRNVSTIKKSGAKTVVFTCPEGLRTFDVDYQDVLGELDFELLHISEFLLDLVDDGDLNVERGKNATVTFHDSCRLGRHLGIYDPPRDLLTRAGVEIKEMANSRDEATCCGVSAFVGCDNSALRMQLERMKEAKRTGAERMLTICPKCRIHLHCAASKELPFDRSLVDIPIDDYTAFLARHLEL